MYFFFVLFGMLSHSATLSACREQVSNSNRHMVEQAARLYLTNWEMESGGADSATITAAELVQQGYHLSTIFLLVQLCRSYKNP